MINLKRYNTLAETKLQREACHSHSKEEDEFLNQDMPQCVEVISTCGFSRNTNEMINCILLMGLQKSDQVYSLSSEITFIRLKAAGFYK